MKLVELIINTKPDSILNLALLFDKKYSEFV
jgi:predicted transcriptional regulator